MIFSRFRKNSDPVYLLTWVTPQLATGHAPMSHAELDSIKKQGIRAILNLCMEIEELARFEEEKGFEVYFLPVMDEGYPELHEMEKALDWLDECIYLGKKVLVHCRHGVGRSGTVIFSYMLRKGLHPKTAGKKLRGLRARPTEHPQKRFLYLYGKKEKPLEIAEPTLMPGFQINLGPYLDRARILLERCETDIPASRPRCGRDHDKCCIRPVWMSLAEAVYLQFGLNTELSHALRLECINRAIAQDETACPVLKDGCCLLYDYRPSRCRVFDRSPGQMPAEIEAALATLTGELLAAFLDREPKQKPPEFTLSDVVSGKFVQRFFHLLPDTK